MAKKIRVTVECGHETAEDIQDLPDGWDDLSQWEQDDYLTRCAVEMLENTVSSGASVVEVDEDGREV